MDESKLLTDVGRLATSLVRVAEEHLHNDDSFNCAKQGVSLLQVRSATLMRYTNNLARYALSRVRGKPDPRLIDVLVQDYVTLGKLRPMAKSLSHHFEHLLKETAKVNVSSPATEKAHRPNPKAFLSDGDAPEMNADDGEENALSNGQDGQYRPPRLTQVRDTPADEANQPRQRSAKKKFSSRNPDIAQAVAEVKGYPQEIRDNDMQSKHDTTTSEREHNLRRKYEESNLTRLPVTKQELKRRRAAESGSTVGGKQVSQFDELLHSVEKISKPRSDRNRPRSGRGRPSRGRK